MIFITVGTHEQPFDRLVEYMDKWAKNHNEAVYIQIGYSTYEPRYCQWKRLLSYNEMAENVKKARLVITHGGPSSFMMPLQVGTIPIVVPRKSKYKEHFNDHQVDFCRQLSQRQGNIIVVEEINKLSEIIDRYDDLVKQISIELMSNNSKFCCEFEKIVNYLFQTE